MGKEKKQMKLEFVGLNISKIAPKIGREVLIVF